MIVRDMEPTGLVFEPTVTVVNEAILLGPATSKD